MPVQLVKHETYFTILIVYLLTYLITYSFISLSKCPFRFQAGGSKRRPNRTLVFTARRYASAVYAVVVCPSVRPSVRPSHLCPSLRISGQLPAPLVNGKGNSLWKWPNFQVWRARDLELDLGSGYTAYRRASVIDIYLHAKFHLNRRNVLWTDAGRTRRTNGRTFETGFFRSTLSNRRPKKQDEC